MNFITFNCSSFLNYWGHHKDKKRASELYIHLSIIAWLFIYHKDCLDLSKKLHNNPFSREGYHAMLQVNHHPAKGTWPVSTASRTTVTPSASYCLFRSHLRCYRICILLTSHARLYGVAQSMLEYFKRMQVVNPAFFYVVQLDCNCVSNIFWVSAYAKMAYCYFEDAVNLGNLCRKNKCWCCRLLCLSALSITDRWLCLRAHSIGMRARHTGVSCSSHGWRWWVDGTDVVYNTLWFCYGSYFCYMSQPLIKREFKRYVDESKNIDEFDALWVSLLGRYYLEIICGWSFVVLGGSGFLCVFSRYLFCRDDGVEDGNNAQVLPEAFNNQYQFSVPLCRIQLLSKIRLC